MYGHIRGKALKELDFQIAIEPLMVDVINPLRTAGILVVASRKDFSTIDLCFYDKAPVLKTCMQTASNHIKPRFEGSARMLNCESSNVMKAPGRFWHDFEQA